jgi:hypothetical protein
MQVQVFQFTDKEVKKQVEAGDPQSEDFFFVAHFACGDSVFCEYQEDQVPRKGPALGLSFMNFSAA